MEFQDHVDLGDRVWDVFKYDDSQEAQQARHSLIESAKAKHYAVTMTSCLHEVHVFNIDALERIGLELAFQRGRMTDY